MTEGLLQHGNSKIVVSPYQLLGNVFRGVRYIVQKVRHNHGLGATSSQYLNTYFGADFNYHVIWGELFEAGLHLLRATRGNTVAEPAATDYISQK